MARRIASSVNCNDELRATLEGPLSELTSPARPRRDGRVGDRQVQDRVREIEEAESEGIIMHPGLGPKAMIGRDGKVVVRASYISRRRIHVPRKGR